MKLIKRFSSLTSTEILFCIRYVFAKFVSLFCSQKKIWLISERGVEARDNGKVFFEYMRLIHPEIDCMYVINRKGNDYIKMSKYEPYLVQYNSFRHLLLLCQSSCLISTHVMGYVPCCSLMASLDKKHNLFRNKKKIFIQHGITFNNQYRLYSSHVNLDLFTCGGKIEYDYVLENFGYSSDVVKYTGFCRYDNLNDFKCKKQLLLMPTWRSYIDDSFFEKSQYYLCYKELLCNPVLHNLLASNGYLLIFYPHFEIQKHLHSFTELGLPNSIKIAGFEYDVQTLLKESQCLITDYSSVFFDMSYMHKPILFYQFDIDKFEGLHYSKGYLDYSKIGTVCRNIDDLLDAINLMFLESCQMPSQFEEYANQMFEIHDNNNCKRVFNEIVRILE